MNAKITNNYERRVVITGVGPISSVGIGKQNFWEGLINKNLNVRKVQYLLDSQVWTSFLKHKIENFNIHDFRINENVLNEILRWKESEVEEDLLYLMAAGKLALEDSNLKYEDKNNIGLIVSHENPGLEQYFSAILEKSFKYFKEKNDASIQKFYDYMLDAMMKPSYELQTFMPLFHLAKMFNLHGYSLFINNACASGAFALEEAYRIIQSGRSDAVLLITGDRPDIYKYLWFRKLNMYSADGIIRPFSSNATGLVVGDGASGIVVESLEHATKRSANIYAEYLGGGFVSESWKVTLPAISTNYYEKVILDALQRSRLKHEDVDFIIPHGVGVPLIDKHEARVLANVLQDCRHARIVALKPYFGHNLGGNVILELIAGLLMMKEGCILPTLNLGDNNTNLNLTTKLEDSELSILLKITCAFAGFNSAIVLKRFSLRDY